MLPIAFYVDLIIDYIDYELLLVALFPYVIAPKVLLPINEKLNHVYFVCK